MRYATGQDDDVVAWSVEHDAPPAGEAAIDAPQPLHDILDTLPTETGALRGVDSGSAAPDDDHGDISCHSDDGSLAESIAVDYDVVAPDMEADVRGPAGNVVKHCKAQAWLLISMCQCQHSSRQTCKIPSEPSEAMQKKYLERPSKIHWRPLEAHGRNNR